MQPRGLAEAALTSFTAEEIPGICRALCRETGACPRVGLLLTDRPLLPASVPRGPGQASLVCAGWLPASWPSSQRQERPLPSWSRSPLLGPSLLADSPWSLSLPEARPPTEGGVKLAGSHSESLEGGQLREVSSAGEWSECRARGVWQDADQEGPWTLTLALMGWRGWVCEVSLRAVVTPSGDCVLIVY